MWRTTGVVGTIAFAAAAASFAAQTHPHLKSKQVTLSSFAVMPPLVSGSGRGLKADEVSSRAETLAMGLGELLTEALAEYAGQANVVGFSQESLGGQEARAIHAAQSAYDGLAAKIQSKPKDIDRGLFTLGSAVRELEPFVVQDVLVFARAAARFSEDMQTSVAPGSFSMTIKPMSDVRARVSFVDAKTGSVLHFFEARGKGESSQTEGALRDGIEAALRGLASSELLRASAANAAPSATTAAAASREKKLSNPEKLQTWPGQKITILGTSPQGCPAPKSDFSPKLTSVDAGSTRSLNQYAGRAGTILEVKPADYQNEILIQLDDGEKVRTTSDMGLAFHAELEAARKLVGSHLWSKGQQTVKLAENRCEDEFPAKPRLSLRNLQKLTVTAVFFGSHLQKLHLTVKTEDGREAILDGWDGYDYLDPRFHLTGTGGVGVKPFSARFYFEDPSPQRR